MAQLNELPFRARVFLRAYRWRRIRPTPWTPLGKPLGGCRVALVSSAGFTLPVQAPFDANARGGDVTFRVLPATADLAGLRESHRSWAFDHAGIRQDPNLALPLDRLRELAASGDIGGVAPRHLSFMGSITATERLVRSTAPDAVRMLVDDAVDVALLVPV